MLSVDLVGESPEDTLPDEARLGVLQAQVVLVVDRLRGDGEVEVGDVEPETDGDERRKERPELEPTFGVHVVKGEIRVTLERAPDREAV